MNYVNITNNDKKSLTVDCYENICAVYVDGVQYIESTLASANLFKNSYYKKDDDLYIKAPSSGLLKIVYYNMPTLKTVEIADGVEVVAGGNVMVPIEFLSLIKAKLKAEMYKIANEDALAAKWMNDYNVLLETFKAWMASKKAKFGIN